MLSTYCLVANCKADTGSCVTVTDVKPAGVNDVAPRAIVVVPSVIDELVSALFGMSVNVFDDPDIDLLVKVCEPVRVATVESMLIVLAVDPSNVVPEFNCRPVPTVSAAVVVAVIVPDDPRATVIPL